MVKIANCMEMLKRDGDNLYDTMIRFLQHASMQEVDGEMAWFTMGKPVTELTTEELDFIRGASREYGVEWKGHHWVGAKAPEPFYLTHPDEKVREATAGYLAAQNKALYTIRGNIPGGVAVVGSPDQRNIANLTAQGIDIDELEALEYFADTLARAVIASSETGVIMAPERLVHVDENGETDIVYTMGQASKVVELAREVLPDELKSQVAAMVDFKAAYGSDETPVQAYDQVPEELRVYHAHVQAGNLGPPGFNDDGVFLGPGFTDIAPDIDYLVQQALKQEALKQQGLPSKDAVLSVEAFPPFIELLKGKGMSIEEALTMGNAHLRTMVHQAEQRYK